MRSECLVKNVDQFSYRVQQIRFLAAAMVIVSHAHTIANLESDLLATITKDHRTLGGVSVYVFMFLSGLYAAKSYVTKSQSLKKLFLNRIKRLIPGLFVTVVLSVFGVGCLCTDLPLKDYFFSKLTWKYFLNCLFVVQHKLPGVFEKNVYSASVNGSLWSLPLEILCFCMVTLLLKLRMISKEIPPIVAVLEYCGALFFVFYGIRYMEFLLRYRYHLHLALIFVLGAFCYIYKEKIYLNIYLQFFSIVMVGVLIYFGVSHNIWIYFLLYFILCFCYMNLGKKTCLGTLGEYSYEFYLVGCLVQQCVTYAFGGRMNPYLNMFFSIPLALIAGILIHKMGERLVVSVVKR